MYILAIPLYDQFNVLKTAIEGRFAFGTKLCNNPIVVSPNKPV